MVAGEAQAAALRAEGFDAHFVAADVSRDADVRAYVEAAVKRWGRIDCFFNNAGIEGQVRPRTSKMRRCSTP